MAAEHRMDKATFLKTLEGRSSEELRTILWTAYWRGSALVRERIEEALNPKEVARKREATEPVDSSACLSEVREFCERARAGDYMRGARDLGRKEVSGWRFTLRRLFDDSCTLLRQSDTFGKTEALEHLLEFTHDLSDWNYFRTEDPVEAAKIVFSDRVELLWRAYLDHEGFGLFLRKAPAQFLRWESPYGWTRYDGTATNKQRPMLDVLKPLLRSEDAFLAFVKGYAQACRSLVPRLLTERERRASASTSPAEWERTCSDRSDRMENWHTLLFDRLREENFLIEEILTMPSLQGPDTWHLLARLRHRQGRMVEARDHAAAALKRHPGCTRAQEAARLVGLGTR